MDFPFFVLPYVTVILVYTIDLQLIFFIAVAEKATCHSSDIGLVRPLIRAEPSDTPR